MTENAVEAGRPIPNTSPEYVGFTRKLQEVVRQMTGYKVWNSGSGALYATRTRDLTDDERAAGLAQTISADTPLGMSEAITEQLRKASELAAKAAEQASDES